VSKRPQISVGLPVYNGEKYLRVAIDSLLNQDFQNFELIIADNASTDATEQICRAYAAADPRVRYHRNATNIGSARNYARVFELARAQFFKWVAHDDYFYPSLLSRCYEVYGSAPASTVLVYPRVDLIDEQGNVFGCAPDRVECRHKQPYHRLAHVLANVSYAYPVFGLARTAVLRRTKLTGSVPYWDESLLAELALYGEILEVPDVLWQQRCHPGNAVAAAFTAQGHAGASDPNKADRKTRRALRMWSDPHQRAPRIWLPGHEEHYWEFAKRVHHARLPMLEKTRCYLTVGRACVWSRVRKAGGKWKRTLAKHARAVLSQEGI
jgi:glycosyltransferase involved in cell wall biosynthesis